MARPAFRSTVDQRDMVAAATAGGMSADAIALALGISAPTLRKHFRAEIECGAAVRRLNALDALLMQVRRGNVAAIRTFLALVPTGPAREVRRRGLNPARRFGR